MSSAQFGNVIGTLGSASNTSITVDGQQLTSSLPPPKMSTESSPTPSVHVSPRNNTPPCTEDVIEHTPVITVEPAVSHISTIPTKSPRSARMTSRSAVVRGSSARSTVGGAPPATGSARSAANPSSNIPLPVKAVASSSARSKASSQSVAQSHRFNSSGIAKKPTIAAPTGNRHTLEVQFINKKKRLQQLKKELEEKQKPVIDLYQNLVQIKKKLEEFGKSVKLEEVKLMNYDGDIQHKPPDNTDGAGESMSPEILMGMQTSIEEIPKTLMDICKNLLGRRNVIVDLLEGITKSEVDVGTLTEKIDTLKEEGIQLQNNLDVVLNEHQSKIKEIVSNWQALLCDKQDVVTNAKVGDLEEKLKLQEKLTEEARQQITELQRKLDDKRTGQDKYITELNGVIHNLKEHLQKAESDLDNERKTTIDYKTRNASHTQTTKNLRNKLAELENDKKNADALNNELNKKIKQLQDQLKHKETAWHKEKEEMSKSLKHQEHLLQKLTADKNTFETRLETISDERSTLQETMQNTIEELTEKLKNMQANLQQVTKERDDALESSKDMEEQIARMGIEDREKMNILSSSIDWGKEVPETIPEAQHYSQAMMKDIIFRELQDRVRELEEENMRYKSTIVERKPQKPTDTEKAVMIQHEVVIRYKQMLAESEMRLTEKSQEVARLTAEIRQLKVRQEHLEEMDRKCPAENLQRMVEEGRNKLNELMKKSLDSEQKILQCEGIIEKQNKQINEMENLLRYRENMAGVLKASRDELILEKESLTRYSHEMRTVLAEVTKESKMKDRLIKELQEKIELRERQISKLEKELHEVETNLVITNEKRYKLQETVGEMEKELQATKAHVNQLADINNRTRLKFVKPF